MASPQAEEMKNLGNEEFKKQNFPEAIKYFSDAIDIEPNEAYFTNRALCYISLKR